MPTSRLQTQKRQLPLVRVQHRNHDASVVLPDELHPLLGVADELQWPPKEVESALI